MKTLFRDRRHDRSDAGFTLIELSVAIVLMGIMFTMIGITFGFIFDQTTSLNNSATSGANAETSLWTLRVPLRYSVTPYTAAVSNSTLPTTTTPCWGSQPPAFYPTMPALPAYGGYGAVAGTPAGGAQFGALVSPQDNALLVAHDFDVVFCAQKPYKSASQPPHVYRLWVDPSTCADHTATGGGGCTLKLDDYGPTNTVNNCSFPLLGGRPNGASTCNTSGTGLQPPVTNSVATNVWCNLWCQEDVLGNLASNPVAPNCQSNPNAAGCEPPMFSYYSSPPSATNLTSFQIPGQSDDKSIATGPNLVGIDDVGISISTITGNPRWTTTSSSNVSTSNTNIYMAGTATKSSALQNSAPVVSSVSPASGPVAGGGAVTIFGANLGDVTSVSFGSLQVPPAQIFPLSDTAVEVIAPASPLPVPGPGIIDVRVTSATAGTSAATTGDNYAYVPTVTGVSPNSGPAAGGPPSVTITGTGFVPGAVVFFGTNGPVSATVTSATSMTAQPPSDVEGVGLVEIGVEENGVTSPSNPPADQYTYSGLPVVQSISPQGGSPAGGTTVTITGTNFAGVTAVNFGANSATNLSVPACNPVTGICTMTVTSPAGSGAVDVIVTTPAGTSGRSPVDLFAYNAPTVTSVSPNAGPPAGGTSVIITGTNFVPGSTVKFGNAPASSVLIVSSTMITAKSPAGSGTVDVTVTNPDGQSAINPSDAFAYGAPTVTSVVPNAGPTTGGTTVQITGTNFVPGSVVSFGGTPPSIYQVNSSTSITAVTQSVAGPETVDVTVTNPLGTSATSPADHFTYDQPPTVTGVNPIAGPTTGGTTVTISGTGFLTTTGVNFGFNPAASYTINSDTSITAVTPAGTAGVVDVTVVNLGGISPLTLRDNFTYDAAPTVTSISPIAGPTTGGTSVRVTGTGFLDSTRVSFGATTAAYTILTDNSITVSSPAHAAGPVDITVTNPLGTSATGFWDRFTYDAAPTVTSVSPPSGPIAGGTAVTITGTGFLDSTGVAFGGIPATFTITSDTSITATSPARPIGQVDVTVVNPLGTSPTGAGDKFLFYGPAAKLVVTTQPSSSTGGVAFGTQPVVTIEDTAGNTVANNTSSVTLSITSGTGTAGATLTCGANPKAATAGVVAFAGCKINKAGANYTLTAIDGGLPPAVTSAFNITVGPAAKLGFTTPPSGGTNGNAWGTQPVVTVQDLGGNTVTTSAASITLAIATQPGSGAVLTCSANPQAATAGVDSFAGCQIVGQAGSYTLTATSAGLTSATSSAFTITPGIPTKVVVTTAPSGGANGTAWGTQPVVTVEDSGSNTVTGSTASITLAIATQPGSGATLSCSANPLAATASVASFAGCQIVGKAGAYTLSASSPGLTSGTSASFPITFGAATQLAVTTQPTSSTGGIAFGTQPVITVEDSGGNTVTTDTSSVTLAISPGTPTTGGPGTLTCTANPVTATAGVATFAGCRINRTGTNYTLTASDGLLGQAVTSALTITVGPANNLRFTTVAGGGANGTVWATQPVVTVRDAGGNPVTTSTASITLAINTQPGSGATLTCTANPKAATAGVDSFTGCQIVGQAGTYSLSASSAGLTSATNGTFTITVGAAAKLAVTAQPSGSTGGVAFATQPVVAVEDSGGNTVTTDTSGVTLGITGGTPATGGPGTLTCTTNPVAAVAGVATFAGCTINTWGTNYTLTATDGALTSAVTSAFNITIGPATKVGFATSPGNTPTGSSFASQPVVSILDAGGNIVTTNTSSVTLAITPLTPTTGGPGTLTCTANPVAATAGVATFTGCTILALGTGYSLTATDGLLTAAQSPSFSIDALPTITLLTPNTATHPVTTSVTITGTGFMNGATVSFSPITATSGLTVNSYTVNSSTSITVNITTANSNKPIGTWNVAVTNQDGGVSNTSTFTVT
jgi:prepilin-type N-terminal cleavage/methylation domain-containing protein